MEFKTLTTKRFFVLRLVFLFVIGLLCLGTINAQNITGTVTDNQGEPLIGVNVLKTGTLTGTTTDLNGKYEIEAGSGDILQFSYVGFISQNIAIVDQVTLDVILVSDAQQLDEVVVIGYGSQKRSHLTGAISKLENKDLGQIAAARIDDALVGKVSGVNIQATEGEAGSAPTIRIRGTGSMVASSDPLVVVDGVIVDNDFLGSMDMNDVESFEVLKDAASSAIYGSRGANGVILVSTKNGKDGKTKFSYNSYVGFKEARHSDAYTFSIAETAAAELAARGELSDRTKYKQLIGIDRSWQDVIFDGGIIQNHSFSARGGSKMTKFSTSFNYLHDEGVLLTDDYKKYGFNVKVNTKLNDRFAFGVSVDPSYTDRRRFDGSVHDILRQTNWLPLYHDENSIKFVNYYKYPEVKIGDYANQQEFDDYDLEAGKPVPSGGTDISNTSNVNPAAKVLERDRNDYKFKVLGSAYAQFNFTKDLNFKTTFSGTYQNTKQDRWQGLLANRNGAANISLDIDTENKIHLVNENYFSYEKEIGKHEISGVLGMSAEKNNIAAEGVSGSGYTSDLLKTISAATTISGASSINYENSFLSFFGRVNYAYGYKYLASLSFRRDGSSVFGPQNKYGNFPAASFGWMVSEEEFLKGNSLLSYLKLRFSYGYTGNNRLDTGDDLIDNYPYLALLNATTGVVNGSAAAAFNAINIANPELQWERSREINPGVDFGLFDDLLMGSLEYYNRTSDQLLLYNPISGTTGFSEALVNLGIVENSGIEIELRSRNIRRPNFTWNTSVLASKNKNVLVDFADSDGQIQNVDTKRAAEWINAQGHPISSFYGWVVDRDIPLEYLNDAYHPVGGQAQDVYVKDLNGDGLIDDDDKTILGDPYPDFIWSVSNDFTFYKNFDFSFMFQGSHGAQVRNMADQYLFNHFNSSQDFNPQTTPEQQFIREKIFTNDIIQDASYITLRNVRLGYTFSKHAIEKTGVLTNAKLYVAAQNLLYFTADDYTGWNPESVYNTSPTTYGYQLGGSPIFRTISVGLNIEF